MAAAAAGHFRHVVDALRLEFGIADRQHLVEQQDVRLEVRRDREGEPHVHAARIAFDRGVDEFAHAGELDDLVEAVAHLGAAHAEDGAVQIDILPAAKLGMESGADFSEQAVDLAVDHRPPFLVGSVIRRTGS